jgi:MFS family permease
MDPASPADTPLPFSTRLGPVPWLVAVALFMENLDATIINTAVPTMALSLGVEPLSLKAVLTSYTIDRAAGVITVTGSNIEATARVTVGGVEPLKVKPVSMTVPARVGVFCVVPLLAGAEASVMVVRGCCKCHTPLNPLEASNTQEEHSPLGTAPSVTSL